jgi:DNA replication and repair protein RecF
MNIHIQTLSLSNFRNYTHARIEVDARPVVLVGANGAGKTNILEAISLLVPGRGFRRAKLPEMDNVQTRATWGVAADIEGIRGAASIGTGRDAALEQTADKRIVKINGKIARAHTELADIFSLIWLTPQMDTLFIEGNSARRKFIDRLVFSFDGGHAARVNAYELVMRERNRLLQMGNADSSWLSALEQKMVENGIAIAVARASAIEGLNSAMQISTHPFPKAHMALRGTIEDMLLQGAAVAAEESFRESLRLGRMQDAGAGRALVGVHRTEVEVTHSEKNMPAELSSTGEQKAVLISIILAQARAGALWHGNVPVLLLDEVATHLDIFRRNALFDELASIGAQAWLTGTDRNVFDGLQAQFFSVENGSVIKN